MDPLWNLPVLNKAVVDFFVRQVRLPRLLFLDKSDAIGAPLINVPFFVHLLEDFELVVIPRDDLVELFVREYFSLLFVFVVHCICLFFTIRQDVLQLLLAILVTRVVVKHPCLDDDIVQVFLLLRLVKDAFLNGRHGDQAVDSNLGLLPDSVSSSLSLHVHLWVPVGVKNDDSVGLLQVQTLATCTRRQNKDLVLGVGRLEKFQVLIPLVYVHGSVDFQVLDSSILEELAHNRDQLDELGKDQDSMAHLENLGQHAVE